MIYIARGKEKFTKHSKRLVKKSPQHTKRKRLFSLVIPHSPKELLQERVAKKSLKM